jgi:hypothetical protein
LDDEVAILFGEQLFFWWNTSVAFQGIELSVARCTARQFGT